MHRNADVLVEFEQSIAVADALKSLDVDVSLECAEGQGSRSNLLHGQEVHGLPSMTGS